MNVTININAQTVNSYEEMLRRQREAILGTEIAKEAELNMMANNRYQEICDKITNITQKPVWEDFNFRTGKILGILRSIIQNPKQRKQLLVEVGLNEAIMDMYNKYIGNLPYVDSNNLINYGKPMQCEMAKQLIQLAGTMLGILVEPSDLDDINEERWNKLYDNALRRAEETAHNNELNKEPEEGYDE